MTALPSLLPRRPSVSSRQAVAMATSLFQLHIEDPTTVKEFDSYDDRNFYMRGSLLGDDKETGESVCQEYILKITNHMDSSHKCLIQAQCDAMLFLQARGYKCPTPVLSISNTHLVKCKIPRGTQRCNVALETDDVTLETNGVTLEMNDVTLERNGVTLERNDVTLETNGVTFESDGVGLETDKVLGNPNITCNGLSSVNTAGNLGYGIEIYDGKEYSEEEYFVCAVRLLTFVPGKMLKEIPLNTELLFNYGMAVGRLDRDLKEFPCRGLERPGFLWDLSALDDTIEQFLDAVDDQHHMKMIQEVCESFRKEVTPKLHLLPKQIIHGDVNYANTVITTDDKIGFIDFGDINYTCRVFELAISLMYILNVDGDLSCGRTRMAGYFFAGYHSINPLSDEELQLLHVLVGSRFCQSLVFGAFTSKYLDPDNEYLLETAKNGWKNFEAFWKLTNEEVLRIWLEISDQARTLEGSVRTEG